MRPIELFVFFRHLPFAATHEQEVTAHLEPLSDELSHPDSKELLVIQPKQLYGHDSAFLGALTIRGEIHDLSGACHDIDLFLLDENLLLVITPLFVSIVDIHGWHEQLKCGEELGTEHFELARVQVVFLDAKEAIELAVASLSSSCNLLLLAFLDVEIVKGPAAYSEMSLPLAV